MFLKSEAFGVLYVLPIVCTLNQVFLKQNVKLFVRKLIKMFTLLIMLLHNADEFTSGWSSAVTSLTRTVHIGLTSLRLSPLDGPVEEKNGYEKIMRLCLSPCFKAVLKVSIIFKKKYKKYNSL